MIYNSFNIGKIPTMVWGDTSEKVLVAVHGNLSHKADTVIELLADVAVSKGYQVLSFDLPEHGERKGDNPPCKVQFCVDDLTEIMGYAKQHWNEFSLFACSMGTYFSLLAYKDITFKQALFLSPVVDMERIISNMMTWFQVTPERLEKEQTIDTPIGQKLYWDYFCYVKEHPVNTWNPDTCILYGSRDEICELDTISTFTKRFHCNLEILDDGEHFFHTDDQLNGYSHWLEKQMK